MVNNNTKSSKKGLSTRQLVIAALFVALALVVKPFEIYILPVARFSFVSVPIIMAGIILGPFWGAGVGVIVDILGLVLMDKSGMAMNPILTLASAMIGFVPGLVFARSGKNETASRAKYNIYNVVCYLGLLLVVTAILLVNGTLSFTDGVLYIISPSSGAPTVVSTLTIVLVAAAFVVYSVIVIVMVTRNPGNDPARQIMPKMLFAVTLGMIIGDILISGLGLGLQYGWPLPLMLVVRIIKSFFAIPVYTLVCFVIYKAAARFRI
ncbi:MAG: folate family ECF transporter S component [Eubacteriaceae bacterium]|nr:folate family ECF transporter S component [Eubacteriaceae bacterium]